MQKQFQVLEFARIVRLTAVGCEVRVSLDVSSPAKAQTFIAVLERQWDRRLMQRKEPVAK